VTAFPTPDITVELDPRNPGQFFACCGLLELASRLWPASSANGWREPEGWFDAEGSRATFHIATASGHNDPLDAIVALITEDTPLARLAEDAGYFAPDRQPILLRDPLNARLDWWLDSYRGGDKSELKVWAGQQTPMRNVQGMQGAWREMIAANQNKGIGAGLFADQWPMTGRFGFDPAAASTAIDVGFSPDEQGIPVLTSPATELLAAIGLQRCRPLRDENSRGRWFIYNVWADPLDISVAAAAVVGSGRAVMTSAFRVVMRNSQYGNFGWGKRWERTS
jgi:CRISPR-associated protein Csx14